MKKTFAIICSLCLVATVANAKVRCHEESAGITKCTGYNENGEYVSLRSRTNSLGVTLTQGRIGDRAVNTRTRARKTTARTAGGPIGGPNGTAMQPRAGTVTRTHKGTTQYNVY